MSLFRRNRPRFLGTGRATPQQAREELQAAVERANQRRAATGQRRRIALIAQLTRGKDYDSVRAYWIKRVPEVARWPESLPESQFALNLWPVAPGAKRATKPGRLKLVATPEFGTFANGYDPATAFAIVTATWLDTTGALELGPVELVEAFIEIWDTGRCRSREPTA